ncbi:TetR/AcrR family transcriptional regulator [Microbacterium sp. KNMS]
MSTSVGRYHHGDLGPALLEAAEALLAERGAAALSLREVARRAGVSHNAPYHHFADRLALLKRLSERHMDALLDAQRRAAEGERDARARLRAIASAYVGYAREHPHGFGIVFDPEVCVPGHPSEAMAPLIRANEELIAAVVAQAAPELDDPTREAAVAGVWGLAHGLATLVVAGHIDAGQVDAGIDGVIALASASA